MQLYRNQREGIIRSYIRAESVDALEPLKLPFYFLVKFHGHRGRLSRVSVYLFIVNHHGLMILGEFPLKSL